MFPAPPSSLSPMTAPTSDDGRLLKNRYRLIELIGKGAMGRVYKAEDIVLGGVIVAVKFLSQTLLNPKMRDRFKNEARTCAQLGHKSRHIVLVIDYGVDYGVDNDAEVPFYVMEYLHGSSLNDIISTQNLPLPRFLNLARQICLGMQCAHQGIVVDSNIYPIIHRDIKPSNILVTSDPDYGELVKILDFGIAKLMQADSNQTSSFMGTLAYASPEQMDGRELDSRSDIYSLGIMMFEMLTGKMPLQAETRSFGGWYRAHTSQTPRSFQAAAPHLKIPKALEALVMSCLAKSPDDRPQTVADVLRALEPLEQRYQANRYITGRISELLGRQPLIALRQPSEEPSLPSETIYQLLAWPQDKPKAQIVFPQVLKTPKGKMATLWVMLNQQEIENIQIGSLYNRIYKNFLCTLSPHPMVLWLTAIYNRSDHKEGGPRWLRCFLDFKSPSGRDVRNSLGREMMQLLAEKGQYYLLFFAIEEPDHCAYVMPMTINDAQRSQLQEWLVTSENCPSGDPSISKDLLKAEFEKLKPRVNRDLEDQSGSSFN
jgi:eukaryotic-like serine/threonine-protein kinase